MKPASEAACQEQVSDFSALPVHGVKLNLVVQLSELLAEKEIFIKEFFA